MEEEASQVFDHNHHPDNPSLVQYEMHYYAGQSSQSHGLDNLCKKMDVLERPSGNHKLQKLYFLEVDDPQVGHKLSSCYSLDMQLIKRQYHNIKS
jgi:hypothetical protein